MSGRVYKSEDYIFPNPNKICPKCHSSNLTTEAGFFTLFYVECLNCGAELEYFMVIDISKTRNRKINQLLNEPN
jgi:hypothetical protein